MSNSVPYSSRRSAYLAVFIITVGTVAATLYHYSRSTYSPSFLSGQSTLFYAFRAVAHVVRYRDLAGTSAETTPVCVVVIKAIHAVLGDGGALVLVALLAGSASAWFWSSWKALLPERQVRIHHVAAVVLLSFPLLAGYEAAGPDVLAFAAVCTYAYLCPRGGRRSRLAWIPLGIAVSVNWMLVLLVLLPISRREWRQAAQAIGTAAVLTAAAVLVLAAGAADGIRGAVSGLWRAADSLGLHDLAPSAWGYGHSFWGSLVVLQSRLGWNVTGQPHARALYAAAGLLVVVALAAFLYVRRPPLWQSLILLIVCSQLLPFWSSDTGLVLLLAPLPLLTLAMRHAERDTLALMALCFLLIPLNYAPARSAVLSAAVLYPLLLICLAAASLRPTAALRLSPEVETQ
jgi:hypothetical protein